MMAFFSPTDRKPRTLAEKKLTKSLTKSFTHAMGTDLGYRIEWVHNFSANLKSKLYPPPKTGQKSAKTDEFCRIWRAIVARM